MQNLLDNKQMEQLHIVLESVFLANADENDEAETEKALVEAKDNANLGHWNLVANRLYYAVFHITSALLIDKGFTAKSHNGIFCILGQEFVRKGLLDREDAKLASRLQNMRQSGDYDDMFDWTKDDVLPLFEKTENLIEKMKGLISVG